MNDVEDRLRVELAELADALLDGHEASKVMVEGDAPSTAAVELVGRARPVAKSGPLRVVALAAGLLVLAGLGYLAAWSGGAEDTLIAAGSAAAPSDFGTWQPIADAPIEPRPYAVTAWTGSEVVVWAGSSLTRGFAYTDGAIYRPETDSWEPMEVPGWGHPGLTSAFFEGELYVFAKDVGTRFDPIEGRWSDLPPADEVFLVSTVATDEGVWGIGPAATNAVGQPDLAVAAFDPASNSWLYGSQFEGADDQAEIVAGLSTFESTTIWSGTEIVVWRSTDGGIAFDPVADTWRTIPHPEPPSGLVRSSVVVELDDAMAVVAEVESGAGVSVDVAVLEENGWRWLETDIVVSNFASVSVAGAGDWVAVFSADEAPVMVHVPSGEWERNTDGPLGGIDAPNTVWTGAQLVVWGGVKAEGGAVDGATWTPPS